MFMPDIINYWFSFSSPFSWWNVPEWSGANTRNIIFCFYCVTRVIAPFSFIYKSPQGHWLFPLSGSKWPSVTAFKPWHPAYRDCISAAVTFESDSREFVRLLMDSHLIGHGFQIIGYQSFHLLRRKVRNLTNVFTGASEESQQCIKLSSDLTSLLSKVNIIIFIKFTHY